MFPCSAREEILSLLKIIQIFRKIIQIFRLDRDIKPKKLNFPNVGLTCYFLCPLCCQFSQHISLWGSINHNGMSGIFLHIQTAGLPKGGTLL